MVNYLLFEYPLSTNIKASLWQLLHLDHSYSLAEGAQDRWIARWLMPGKRDGFYADVGSADGTISSDTKLPDELGWKGVCIDPFPAHMEDHTCQVFRQPVFSESGKKVTFRAAGELRGIDLSLGSHKAVAEEGRPVQLVTATLDEILDKAKAPRRIDYIEPRHRGGKPNALRGWSPEKHAVSAFTIETNGEADKREGLREFLESKGYVRVRSWATDDWYVRPELAKRFRFSVERWPRQF